jgi:hypothetical protein
MSQTHAAARAAGHTQPERLVRLRGASIGVVVMLIIQFILGMIYNLYGTAPTSTKSIGLFSGPTIALHVIVGILVGLAAIAQLVRAIGTRHSPTIWLSALGLLSIVGAGFAGLGFAGSGAAGASLGMSLAFAVALACYVALIVVLPSAASPVPGSSRAAADGGQSSTT